MEIRLRDSGDLKALGRDLRAYGVAGKKLSRALSKGLRDEARPIAKAVKAAYRSNPSHNPKPRLRAALARATTVQVRLSGRTPGVRILVLGKKMPDGMGRLPRLYEGESPWRHPYFGGDRWYPQKPKPTFYRTVRLNSIRMNRRLDKVADAIVRDLGK